MIMQTDKDFSVLKQNLKGIKSNFLEKDNDYLMIIAGREGSGKSSVGIKACAEIDPTFNPERICFNPYDILKCMKTAKKGQAILWDEAGEGGYSRDSMKQINNIMNKVLMYARAKNLFIVVIIPNFFMLDKYIRISRVGLLVYIKKRGEMRIFSNRERGKQPSAIIQLTIKGQKYYNMNEVNPEAVDYFQKLGFTFKEWGENGEYYKQYIKRKDNFINNFIKNSMNDLKKSKEEKPLFKFMYNLIKHLQKDLGYRWKDLQTMGGNEMKFDAIRKFHERLRDKLTEKEDK